MAARPRPGHEIQLRAQARRLLGILLDAADTPRSTADLADALYVGCKDGGPMTAEAVVQQHLHYLRLALPEGSIRLVRGYVLTAAGRAAAAAIIAAQATRAEPAPRKPRRRRVPPPLPPS